MSKSRLTRDGRLDYFGKDFFGGYDFERNYPKLEAEALRLRRYCNPAKVLDVGCAKGFLVLAFRKMGVEAWGVDVSEYALSKAPSEVQAYLAKVDLGKDALPFEDAEFDLVTSLGVFYYVPNYRNALAEIRRVLRPQGILCVGIRSTPYPKPDVPIVIQNKNSWINEIESHGFMYLENLSRRYYREHVQESIKASRGIEARAAAKLLVHPFLWSLLVYVTEERKFPFPFAQRGRLLFIAGRCCGPGDNDGHVC